MRRIARRGCAAVAGTALAAALAACASDTERYCDALQTTRPEIAALAVAAEDRDADDALARTVELLAGLESRAPRDIADEWATLVRAYEGLVEAFAEAGVAPDDYDPSAPAELPERERARIERAAAELASQRVLAAAEGVEQHGRDVCKVDLGLGRGE